MDRREKHLADLKSWYKYVEVLPEGEYVAVYPLMFHWTMVRGHLDDEYGCDDRWCYANEQLAINQLDEWRGRDFKDEPEGWHRHPKSGRRREDGDANREVIAH